MKQKNIFVLVCCLGLGACGEPCTEASLQEKSVEITEKIQKLATEGDVSKLMSLTQKAQKISQSMSGSDDLEKACEAADELLDELD